MQFSISNAKVQKFKTLVKWGKVLAKLAAIGATVSGAMSAISGYATTGIALSVAGTTTYAATKGSKSPYEKTKHVPPGRVDRMANLMRMQEMESARAKGMASGTHRAGALSSAARMPITCTTGIGAAYNLRKS